MCYHKQIHNINFPKYIPCYYQEIILSQRVQLQIEPVTIIVTRAHTRIKIPHNNKTIMQSELSDIKRQIEYIEFLFENKQVDEFVQRVEKYILPHFEKDHHSGKYKERVKEQRVRQVQKKEMGDQLIERKNKVQQKVQAVKTEVFLKQQQQKIIVQKQLVNQKTEARLYDQAEAQAMKQLQKQLQEKVSLQQKEAQQQQEDGDNIEQKRQQEITQVCQQVSSIKAVQQKINAQAKQHQQQLPTTKHQSPLVKEQISKNQQPSTSQPQQKEQPQHPNPQPTPSKQPIPPQSPPTSSSQQKIRHAIKHSKIHILEKYDQMKLILFKIQREMQKLQTPMSQSKEWKVNKINSSSSIGVKTKGTLIEIRYQGIVETNIFNFCVMVYLSQLYKEWVPFCSGSKTITEPSPLQKIVLMDMKIPFLTERYVYVHGIAIDRITKNGKLYIYAQGISHQKELLTHVHKADKTEYEKKVAKSVVLDAKYMVCEIGNQGNGKYSVKVYGVLDSHMPLLPEKVVNYIVKQLGGMIFEKIVKKAKDIKNSPWQKQLKENQKRQNKNRFYSWLNERIANWDKTEAIRKSKI